LQAIDAPLVKYAAKKRKAMESIARAMIGLADAAMKALVSGSSAAPFVMELMACHQLLACLFDKVNRTYRAWRSACGIFVGDAIVQPSEVAQLRALPVGNDLRRAWRASLAASIAEQRAAPCRSLFGPLPLRRCAMV
jgi:hypothetical protein